MLHGVTVEVLHPTCGGRDRFGDMTEGVPKTETVADVLIAPGGDVGSTDDLEAMRKDGDEVSLQIHFPKAYKGDLRGCDLNLPAPWDAFNPYRVVGNPQPYIDANTPTRWHMPVKAVSARG